MSFRTLKQDESEQGRIQGALYSLQALASGVGPVVLRFVYGQCKDSFLGPGAMFIMAGGLYFVAVGFACALPKDKANARRRSDDDADINFDDLLAQGDCESSGSYGSISSNSSS